MDLELLFGTYKTKSLHGRYISLTDIETILFSININNNLREIGKSVKGKPIYTYTIGNGQKKVLLWSQMHGNESTTTKALFDFLQLLNSNTDFGNQLQQNFTICCIPMLNPDGSEAYTRENANNIDLNRDFQAFSQPESRLLMQVFKDFKPDYCYNLHDQRTIYGTASSGKPATVSFLAPAFNEKRDYNLNRIEACRIINAMNKTLQDFIPGQIGRFDDTFNNNCCGDSFQAFGVPTILFEAGHFKQDYDREIVRKLIFIALISSFNAINENDIVTDVLAEYLNIPQNKVNFYDIIYKNVQINYEFNNICTKIAIQFSETLFNNNIEFNAEIVAVGDLDGFFGHFEFDAENQLYRDKFGFEPKINAKANFTIGDEITIVNGVIVS